MDFVCDREVGTSTLIVDNDKVFGEPVLKSIIKKLLNEGSHEVHIYLFRSDSTDLLEGLDVRPSFKLKIHDFSSDNLGWITESKSFEFPSVSDNTVVFIDDLSKLIDLTDCNRVCRLLNRFNNEFKSSKLIALVRGDLHDLSSLKSLEHCSQTLITLNPTELPHFYTRAVTIVKKPNSSVKKYEENISISNGFDMKSSKCAEAVKVTQKGDDPLSNLTFNVSLKSSEVEARNNLVLPYLAAQEVKVNKAPANIEYVPDEFDDLDEDDPDDDLDI